MEVYLPQGLSRPSSLRGDCSFPATRPAALAPRSAAFSQAAACIAFGGICRRRVKCRTSRSAREDLAELEAQLRVAVEEEDYAEAARLRDLLQMESLDAEAAVLSANGEFYAAFREGSAERMAKIWLPSPRSCCVHPGRPPLHGFDKVADSWQRILSQGGGLDIECTQASVAMCGNVGRIVCYEKVEGRITLLAVNLFESTKNGWKMSFHSAAPVVP
ncbi:unnamed protein product [Effrenium voratum]|uniref:SnoaL-like domain-containing protein n=1 Tax=Effrenium voratum TaxID=2562239 RepID=A0AA36MXY1_9DINO|nr:unnamed protein product [Effrenium voratum]